MASPSSTRAPAARLAAALVSCAAIAVLLAATPAAATPGSGGGSGWSDGFFVRHPEAVVAPLGDEAALKCVLGFAAERLRWRKDGRLLASPNASAAGSSPHHHHQHHGRVRSSELPLRLAHAGQAGAYQCVAYFGASARASLPGRVAVAELLPFPALPPGAPATRRVAVPEGCTVALRWPTPQGAPPPVLEFLRDGRRIAESEPRARLLEASGALLLVNVTRGDAALYAAAASNYLTGQRVVAPDSVRLDVLPGDGTDLPPSLLEPPPRDAYNVSIGGNVTLECAGAGRPVPAAEVAKYGGELPRGRSEKVAAGLRLWGAARADAGTYICTLRNRAGLATHVITLMVQEPPEMGRLPNVTTVQEGEGTSFRCEARGSPPPALAWLFNGEDVVPDDHIKIAGEAGGLLQLSRVEKRHAGTYQCFASNAAGDAVRSVELQVVPKQIPAGGAAEHSASEGAGEAPTSPPATSAPVTASAATPSNPAGAAAAAASAAAAAAGGRKKPHHRGGGAGGAGAAGVRRKDKNRHRGGAHGDKDAMIPPSKPVVTRLSDTSVMVRWDVPSNDGLPILFFKVQYREAGGRAQQRRRGGGGGGGGAGGGGGGKARAGPGTPDRRAGEGSRWMTHNEDISEHRRSLKVDNLRPDHTYRFRVAAVYVNNDNKPGPISDKFMLARGEVGNELAAPTLKEAEALSPTALHIRWEYTASSRAPAQGFYVHYRPASTAGDYLQVTVEGESEREFTLTHLEPNTAYEVKVQSFNPDSASNFSNIRAQKTLPAPTEEPPSTEAGGAATGQADAAKGQLFTVLWPVLGGLAALGLILVAIFLCRRRRLQAGAGAHQDKLSDPGMQSDAAAVFALNSKNILNGRLPQNGHHPGTKINITTNPLADSDEDKNQNVVEMSSQNNNQSSSSGSGSGAGRSSIASDAEMDSHVDGDMPPAEVRNWRGPTSAGTASEKYV